MDWVAIWTGVGAVCTGFTMLAILVGGFLAYRQLRETGRSSKLQGASVLLSSTDQGDLRPVRRLLYAKGLQKDLDRALEPVEGSDFRPKLDKVLKDYSEASAVVLHDQLHGYVASLETVAMFVLYGLAPYDMMTGYFGRIVLHHWPLLKTYREQVRAYYGYDVFLQHLERWHRILEDPQYALGAAGAAARRRVNRGIRKARLDAVRQLQVALLSNKQEPVDWTGQRSTRL
jgi:hypothetical protein